MTEGPYYLEDERRPPRHHRGQAGDAASPRPHDRRRRQLHADPGRVGRDLARRRHRQLLRFRLHPRTRRSSAASRSPTTPAPSSFRTIYPGWYQGRAVHIHLKAHKGGNEVHTTQLFFDEATSDAVFTSSPYDTRSGRRTTNAQDGIYGDGGAKSTPAFTKDGDGYVGTLTLGIINSV